MSRPRLRDLGIVIGTLPTAANNAITDIPGVKVGHATLIYDQPRVARTGVTIIFPREKPIWQNQAFAAYHSFNGNGEMTGLPWLDESGMLGSPIGITNTHQVGIVRDTLVDYEIRNGYEHGFLLPVVAETFDGWLNDIDAFHITRQHVYEAIGNASGGAVPEGNVGGGTGMMCHGFKGGIGTSSRVVSVEGEQFTVGVLVQANYGRRHHLRVDGVPVGKEITPELVPVPLRSPAPPVPKPGDGSIIIIVGTDAPLLPIQCRRLAQRATVGLARVGGTGYNGSGDIFLAFATGNDLSGDGPFRANLRMLALSQIDPLFDAVAEATEESILNALVAAETMVGYQGRTAYALPHDLLQQIMARYGRQA